MAPTETKLFTPGPLSTSATVRQSMLRDVGSRDESFIKLVRSIRAQLLTVAGLPSPSPYEAVLLQGSGTYAVEAVLSSSLPPGGHLLILVNGAYGERMVEIARRHRLPLETLHVPEDTPFDPRQLDHCLAKHPGLTHVAVVHCETSSGLLNPVAELGRVAGHHQRRFLVDAMSSFGAIPLDLLEAGIDFLVSSANKCLEGVPGFAFVLARRDALKACAGQARTLSLDLFAQWLGLEKDGQFRFTPPTHALLAFHQALRELDQEGGPRARYQRYRENERILLDGMRLRGFKPYLADARQSGIILSFHEPDHPKFRFEAFYRLLASQGFVIYPGKLTAARCFRIGCIGQIYPSDCVALLEAVGRALETLGCPVPLP